MVGTPKTVVTFGGPSQGFSSPTGGYAQLFQRLIGYTPRYPFLAGPDCWEHASKPYMTDSDVSDWRWVTIAPKQSTDAYVQPYDLPSLEKLSTIKLAMPRVGFYTTPAFLALWNTNDSNQHRVTMNQTLLAALGQSFTSDNNLMPLSEVGLASSHTTTSGECYGCHKSLDPMRMFFGNQYDFNDRNDFVSNPFNGSQPNARPASPQMAGFAFADVNWAAPSSGTEHDRSRAAPLAGDRSGHDRRRRARCRCSRISVAQQLCFWANSNACSPSDPVFRGVVADFVSSKYNFPALVKELFSSPLVTGAAATATYPADSSGNETVPISIARQAHLCAALSNRMGISDVCALQAALPTSAQNTTLTIAGSVAADAFSRGSQTPVTPAYPDLFYRAATRGALRERRQAGRRRDGRPVHQQHHELRQRRRPSDEVRRAGHGDQPQRFDPQPGAHDPGDPLRRRRQGEDQVRRRYRSAQTNSVRSTFVLACESPTSLGIGL